MYFAQQTQKQFEVVNLQRNFSVNKSVNNMTQVIGYPDYNEGDQTVFYIDWSDFLCGGQDCGGSITSSTWHVQANKVGDNLNPLRLPECGHAGDHNFNAKTNTSWVNVTGGSRNDDYFLVNTIEYKLGCESKQIAKRILRITVQGCPL